MKELTSNLEESGRRNSICSREDSIVLRQLVADVLTAMMSSNKSFNENKYNSGVSGSGGGGVNNVHTNYNDKFHQSSYPKHNFNGFNSNNSPNAMNMFDDDDDLEKGFNISKDMTFVYAISKNFRHEVVGALFEWLYHSGIA